MHTLIVGPDFFCFRGASENPSHAFQDILCLLVLVWAGSGRISWRGRRGLSGGVGAHLLEGSGRIYWRGRGGFSGGVGAHIVEGSGSHGPQWCR